MFCKVPEALGSKGIFMDDQSLQELRVSAGDYQYYKHCTNQKLLDELNHHANETLGDAELMQVEDLRTFYIRRLGTIVRVLHERAEEGEWFKNIVKGSKE